MKNRNKEAPSFANINLFGKCNVNCYFCLGKDIESLLSKHNQLNIHFKNWKNFDLFLDKCKENKIIKLYITGQNTDSLMYKYLDELIDFLQEKEFSVGLRTNGYLALKNIDTINKCQNNTGYSIHSLNPKTNKKILGTEVLPDWEKILLLTKNSRVSIVLNRYNSEEFLDILKFISKFENVRYIQVRRVSTDTREEELKEDVLIYDTALNNISKIYPYTGNFYLAKEYTIFNKLVYFWATVETSINSFNYFTDGTISTEYFIVEGYLKNYQKEII